jgi:hypothetical protein
LFGLKYGGPSPHDPPPKKKKKKKKTMLLMFAQRNKTF